MNSRRENSRSVSRRLIIKFATLAILTLIPAGVLRAQDPTEGIPVAHPWDVDSSIPAPAQLLTPEVNLSLSPTAWTPLGPAPILNGQRPGAGPVSGRLTGIAADPADANTIYVAAAGGGVWKTTNRGATWNPLTDTQSTLSMGAIAIAPSNPLVVYAGTGEANNSGDSNFGRGILVSTDGGITWTLQNNGGLFDRRTISEIVIDPGSASVAYAAVADFGANGLTGNTGIWKTTNGGATWINTTAAITTLEPWSSVRIDLNSPATLYAAVGDLFGSAQNGVYKSTNGGGSWSLLTGAPSGTVAGRIVIAVSKANSQVLYVSASGTGVSGSTGFGALFKIMRSDNGGTTFTDLTAATPNYMGAQGWYDTTLLVDPANSAIVYASGAAGSNSILRSVNSGVSWIDINTGPSGGPHADHHAVAFDANGVYLDGDDGGIYSFDNPATSSWTQLNGNLSTIQFQGLGLHPTNPNIALGGSQDNGTALYTGSLGWTLVEGGDGGFVKFSRTNPSRVYHQAPVGSFGSTNFFRRSDGGGAGGTWIGRVSGITDNSTSTQNFYAPFVVDPGNGNRLLFGAQHLWESTNGGDSWSAASGAFSANIGAIGLSASDANTIYVAAAGNIFVTINHGATYTPHNLPVGGSVGDIQVDPANSQTAYAAIRQFQAGGNVFRTTNGGATWTNITGDLPNVPVWSIQIDPLSPGTLYVGNDIGVYQTTNLGITWTRFATGLPDAQVFQIEFNSTSGILGAATHGRGMWAIDIPSAAHITTTRSAVTLNRATGRLTQTVTMTNNGPALSASALVLDSLTPGLTLFNATGTTSVSAPPAGSPYIETGAIGAGGTISITLQFTRVGSPVVAYTARVLGPGAR